MKTGKGGELVGLGQTSNPGLFREEAGRANLSTRRARRFETTPLYQGGAEGSQGIECERDVGAGCKGVYVSLVQDLARVSEKNR